MSGGHYDYACHKIRYIIDDIETDINNDFYYEENDCSYTSRGIINNTIKKDSLSELTPEQREKFIKKAKSLIKRLKKIENDVHTLEWCMSSDYSKEDFIND